MAAIALFINPDRPEAVSLATDLIDRLVELGHMVNLAPDSAKTLGFPRPPFPINLVKLPGEAIEPLSRGESYEPNEPMGSKLDLAVSLGGDGSMLRAVSDVADEGVPVLGVNYGSLGYLTDIKPEAALSAIEQFLAGDYTIEERLRLHCRFEDGTSVNALNEAIVEKVDSGRTVNLAVRIDGEFFTSYAADGLIAATPTGSTAYSLSAGGPILAPTMNAVILTPVAPHTLFDRSLVLLPSSQLEVEVLGDRPAAVAVDGRSLGELGEGGVLTVSVSDRPARLVTLGRRGFHQALKSSFGLSDR